MSKENNNIRFDFIESVVWWEGQINATHLATKFQLSRQAASTVLQLYREKYPQNLRYNQSSKAFIATTEFNNQAKPSLFSNYLVLTTDSPQNQQSVNVFAFEVEAPLRNINPIQVRPILRAIREKLAIDIGYISLSSPDYLDRIIQPHALIFDGLRWHVRAFCNKNEQFRDFTLSRFNGEATFEGKATHLAEQDNKVRLYNLQCDMQGVRTYGNYKAPTAFYFEITPQADGSDRLSTGMHKKTNNE